MRTLIVSGFLAKDSEVETLPSGSKLFKAVLASNEYGDEKNEDGTNKAVWVNISSFKEDAIRKVQYLKKGSNIIAIGDLKTRVYQAKNGEWQCGIELSNADIKFNGNGSSKKDDVQHSSFPDETPQKGKRQNTDDDIPIISTPINMSQPQQIPDDSDDLPF